MTRQNEESRREIVLYQAPDGTVELDVRLKGIFPLTFLDVYTLM